MNRKDVQCLNCGIFGHTCKYCNCPTTSFGVICYKIVKQQLYFLLIQRKDTLCYVEFVRGNYNIRNRKYILSMFNNMTPSEREFIKNNTFDTLWNTMWVDNHKKNHSHYKVVKDKFYLLKKGYNMRNNEEIQFFNLQKALENSESCIHEQEWEFPKGRRKLGEKDFLCAIREFHEESNVKVSNVSFVDTSKYYEEIYLSMNKTRYRNVFYLGKYNKEYKPGFSPILFDENNINQTKEVRDVKWLTYTQVMEKFKNRNREKIEMFRLAYESICKKIEQNIIE